LPAGQSALSSVATPSAATWATAPDAVITSKRRPSPFIRPPVTARPIPATASAAPTRAREVQPHPADRARPPSQAPPALARLNAEWLEAAAIVGASFALAMSSICTGVVMRSEERRVGKEGRGGESG